ncbi:MAG: hypothetical protein KAU14_01665 [Thermoplasmata archaeon]|nr:hypothetical protein [Thermoplasmata archaeon]
MSKKHKHRSGNPWAEAKTRYRLNARQIAMAKALGMNPKKFGKYAGNKSEPWKAPLDQFIEKYYRKRFGDKEPPVFKPGEKRES